MPHGGKRAGAGRPKGTYGRKRVEETEARAILVESLLKDWEPIIETMKQVGMGTYVVPEGQSRPDTKLLLELSSFIIGRPKQEFGGTISVPQIEQLTKDIRGILSNK